MNKEELIDIMLDIARMSDRLGIETYAVGGLVRDFILNRPSDDLDITSDNVEALADEIVRKGGKVIDKNSERFLGKIVYYRGIKIDLIEPRKESYTKRSFKPIVEKSSFSDDVLRRDFTINTLMYYLTEHGFMSVRDITDRGLEDLSNKILNTPLNPYDTFMDDPSRMLRAVRFASVLNFDINHDVVIAIRHYAEEINRIPKEIIHDEIVKGAISPSYFRIMDYVGLTDVLFPEVTNGRNIMQPPEYHTQDVYEHILRTTEKLNTNNPLLRIAAFLHDVGKPVVDDGSGHFYHHIPKGIPVAEEILRRLKFSNAEAEYITKVIRFHHIFHDLSNLILLSKVRRGLRRFLTRESEQFVEDIYEHSRADIISDRPHYRRMLSRLNKLMDLADEIREQILIDNSKEKLAINGYDIMDRGYVGKEIGEVKDMFQEKVDSGELPNDRVILLYELDSLVL